MANNTIGVKIELKGEKEYSNAIKNIKKSQSELRSEMKLQQTQFKNSQNSIEALKKKQEILSKQYEQSAKKVEVCTKAVAEMTQKQEAAAAKVDKLEKEYSEANNKLSELKETLGEGSEEYQEQARVVEKLSGKLNQASDDYTKATGKVEVWQASLNYATEENLRLNDELQETSKYLAEAENSVDGTAKSIDEYGNEVEEAGDKTSDLGEKISANLLSQAIVAGIKALTSAVKGMAEACIESGSAFEASMSNVQALSGATEAELQTLNDTARQAGENTVFSASEAADALGYMALAGWKTEEMCAGLEPVLNLAAAANTDLARTSDIVTDYLTAFGLAASDAEKFTDEMAYAMANSNTNVEQLGEAYKNCASTAHSMGISVEEVTAVLATMANAGVKGGEAGTGLNAIMTRLATNTKKCGDVLEGYGVQVYDAYGNMNSLSEILTGMAGIWEGLTDQEQANLAKIIAGQNQYSKLQTIMNGLSEDVKAGGKSFEDYRDALMNCDGTAKQMAETMQNNLKGKLKMLESALESLKISTYDVFDETMKEGVDSATSAVKRLNESVTNGSLNTSLHKLADSAGNFAESAIELGEKALPGMIDALAWLLDNGGTIATGLGTIVAATTAYKVATAASTVVTEGATIAQMALNAAMAANPVGLVIAGVVALTGALLVLDSALSDETSIYDEQHEEMEKIVSKSGELNDSIRTSIEERKKNKEAVEHDAAAAKSLVEELKELQSKTELTVSEQARQKMIVDQLNEVMPDLNLAIDEQTGKLNMSTDALEKNVDALMNQAKAEAAREDMVNIAKEQYEAEKQLAELETKRNETLIEQSEATKRAREELETYGRVTDETQEACTYAKEALDEYRGQINETKESIKNLTGEYETAQAYLEDTEAAIAAAEAIGEVGDAADGTGQQLSGMTQAAQEAFADMLDAVSKSIESQISMFDEFESKTDLTKTKLLENMQSQIDGVTMWADNLDALAERGIDQGLLAHLAQMGPEGAAYVALFADMTDEELEKAAENFNALADLPSEVTEKYGEAWLKAGEKAGPGYKEGLDNSKGDIDEANEELVEEMESSMEDAGVEDAAKEAGEKVPKSMAEAERENISEVEDASREIIETIDTTMDEELKSDGTKSSLIDEKGKVIDDSLAAAIRDNSDKPIDEARTMVSEIIKEVKKLEDEDWNSIGFNITTGIAQGVRDGRSGAINEVQTMCQEMVAKAKAELKISSPSKVFRYLGLMSGEGYVLGLEEGLGRVDAAIGATIPDTVPYVASNKRGSGQGDIYQEINVYSPTDDLIDTARAFKQSQREAAMAW